MAASAVHQVVSPWRVPDFRVLFGASALSQVGTNVGYVALPLLAVTTLDASPGQVGALAALSTLAFVLIGLPAGAWIDRLRHRRVLVAADLARAVLVSTVPVAWWLDVLTLGQLYAVVLLTGCATVFFDVGSQSVLPHVVEPPGLVRANAAVVTLIASSNIAGRGAGGGLVQIMTAPLALAVSAGSHLASALRLLSMSTAPSPAPRAERPSRGLGSQIAEGLRHVSCNAELRALALTAGLTNLGSQMINTMLPVLLVRQLRMPAGVLGLFWAAGGVGLLLGARCARPLAARIGFGRLLGVAGALLAPAGLLVGLVERGTWLWVAGAGWSVAMIKTGMDNVLGVSLRQQLTPPHLLGRMNATFRFAMTGALAAGAALAGVCGQLVGVRATVWGGAIVVALAFVPVLLSPVRSRLSLPDGEEP